MGLDSTLNTSQLRRELALRNRRWACGRLHGESYGGDPVVVYAPEDDNASTGVLHSTPCHGNFFDPAYAAILSRPAWMKRFNKVHPLARRSLPKLTADPARRWRELDSCMSSDALLMNIFCYRRRVDSVALSSILGVRPGLMPVFGFRPRIPLHNGKIDRTEVDMKLGEVMVEAKLTETDFQSAPWRMIERYRDINEIFDPEALRQSGNVVRSYQLVRGVLAAHSTDGSFCVICDARRPDLIESWYSVMCAVRSCVLRCRLQLLTWQELTVLLPRSLQQFLAVKYGITC